MARTAADLMMRFDLRLPTFAATSFADQHRAFLDMCRWAEDQGFARIMLSEHHGDPAGYTQSPLTLAAAVLTQTSRIELLVAALLVPLHDPARLAEQLAVIDCIAPGRLSVVVGAGYRKAEFEMAQVPRGTRTAGGPFYYLRRQITDPIQEVQGSGSLRRGRPRREALGGAAEKRVEAEAADE